MFRIASRFKCGDTECVVLRKNGRPLVVEAPYIDLALDQGAEYYHETCPLSSDCWIEIEDEYLTEMENEMEWIFGW